MHASQIFFLIIVLFVGVYNDSELLATTSDTVYCKGGKGTLTQNQLRTIIDTVAKIFGKGYGTTILTADCMLSTYISGKDGHSEEQFLAENSDDLDSFPDLWINNSPCPSCAKKLIDAYKNVSPKATIHAAHFYSGGNSNKAIETALQCLAKMVKSGVNLESFNWEAYQKIVSHKDCKEDIKTALKTPKFVENMNKMANRVKTVYDYAKAGKTSCP